MARALANQSTFSFAGQTYFATSVSVEAPTPEIVNMTPIDAPVGTIRMVPTGDFTAPGRIEVQCLGFNDPKNLVGVVGSAVFQTPLGSVTKNAVCDAASTEGQVGSLLQLRFSLMPTDYYP